MKLILMSSIVFWMHAALALTPEFNAYMRAGTGANSHGGAMECYNNKGTATGNEFRLGNECGIYGEFLFGAHLLKSDNPEGAYWRLGSNFAFAYNNSTDFETMNTTYAPNGPTNWIIRELYTEGGNFEGMPFSVWAGKRFYRWSGMHMDDLFPVDMSGPGAGIGDLKTDWGAWSVGFIQNSESTEFTSTDKNVATDKGRAAKSSLHIRLEDLKSSFGTWAVWLAGGMTPAATSTAAATPANEKYKSTSGAMLALKNDFKIGPGKNQIGLAYGQGVMSNITARGDLVRDCTTESDEKCTVNKSNRIRVWEGYVMDWNRWSGEVAVIYDDYNKGTNSNSHVRWTSVGIRPMYWFTDHFSLAAEAGLSNVFDESDFTNGRTHNLVRTTIAPQLSLGKGYESRPVIRAFYTRNAWNDENKAHFASQTSSANDTEAHNFGVQTEIWF